MARRQVTTLVDDFDGTESDDVKTRTFGIDNVTYEMDLTDANYATLRAVMAHVVANGRRLNARGRAIRRIQLDPDPRTVRRWAQDNDIAVPSRGRVPQAVFSAFQSATDKSDLWLAQPVRRARPAAASS